MPEYFYEAKSFNGETKSGLMEAENEHVLSHNLRQIGYILVKAKEKESKDKKGFNIPLPFLEKKGVPLTEKIMFTRNLQIMISAGVPLPKALNILMIQSRSKVLKDALRQIRENVIKGRSFAKALSDYPNIFSDLFIGMMEVAEEAGTIESVLKNLTHHMQREHELKSKIIGALMYPSVVITAMLGVGLLMLIMVVPKLANTFKEFNVELPLATRLVIGSGTFMVKDWYIVILIAISFVVFLKFIIKTKKGKIAVDFLSLKIPIISSLVKKTNSAYTIGTLSSLIDSGVPIVRALEIISGAMPNVFFKTTIMQAAKDIKKGKKLSETLDPSHKIFSPLVTQMIQVGEESGQTAEVLSKLAEFFEGEVTETTQRLSSIIEPIIMLVIGGAVGFFAVSMVQPMYSILQSM